MCLSVCVWLGVMLMSIDIYMNMKRIQSPLSLTLSLSLSLTLSLSLSLSEDHTYIHTYMYIIYEGVYSLYTL